MTVLAIVLANLFYWGHRHILIHDARGYYELSKIITQNGIFNFSDDKHTMNPVFHVLFELRTYGYPLFLALCSLFTNQEQSAVQLTVFVIQLLICLVLCYYCARSLQSVFRYPGFGRAVYTATVLNPFLLISTTEVLTDFLSAVVIYLVFVLSIKVGFDLYQEDNLLASQETGTGYACPGVFIVSFLAGFSVMLRPANVSIVAALIFIWSMRAVMTRTLSLKLLLLTVLGLSIPVQCNESAGFSLIREKWEPKVSDEKCCFQRRIAILESRFRTARFNESVADHRRIVNRRTEIQPKVLRNDRVSEHRGRRL